MQDPALSEEEIREHIETEYQGMLTAWRNGWNAITRECGDSIALDPLTHTLELKSELERRAYPAS